jgi:hypothetical protein
MQAIFLSVARKGSKKRTPVQLYLRREPGVREALSRFTIGQELDAQGKFLYSPAVAVSVEGVPIVSARFRQSDWK